MTASNLNLNAQHSLTISVSVLEAGWARRLSAQSDWHGAAAATVTVRMLREVLRCCDTEGRVTGIYSVALGVHRRVTQEVIRHWRLCWRRDNRKWNRTSRFYRIKMCCSRFCYVRLVLIGLRMINMKHFHLKWPTVTKALKDHYYYLSFNNFFINSLRRLLRESPRDLWSKNTGMWNNALIETFRWLIVSLFFYQNKQIDQYLQTEAAHFLRSFKLGVK